MYACIDGELVDHAERDDLRDTRARDTRVIHEAWPRAQVVIRDALSPHIAEVRAAIRSAWPFNGDPIGVAAARIAGELVATPVRAAVTTVVVAVTTLIVLAAHAAS
jgi:hypothetical protein